MTDETLYSFSLTGKLADIYETLNDAEAGEFYDHFTCGTPASVLADILTKHGYPISATTIKEQRRKNKIGK